MDLLEHGRSLDELGRSMSWVDIAAMVQFSSTSSHFWAAENPEQARATRWLEELSTPQSTLLGELYDLVVADQYLRAGHEPPDKGIISRLAKRVLDAAGERPTVEKPARKRAKSATEIRDLVKARSKK